MPDTSGWQFNEVVQEAAKRYLNSASANSSAAQWQYAGPTGGITNTTAVEIAPAVAGQRQFVNALQYANTGVASELVLLDGGSTVMWRGFAPATTGDEKSIPFILPLKSSVGNAINVQMVTTASATRVSAQGYTGT